ncbi:MAG: indole-3-glycerol-phosphate synthase [Thermoguttaceae bacterium]|nr:indole-3-glycerol-phosphate synthase [Thermoguttaceae bacterium]
MRPLECFFQAKEMEIQHLRQCAEMGNMPPIFVGSRPPFIEALRTPRRGSIAVIAEYKRASPSRGLINAHLSPELVATQFVDGGASALSVLTEEKYFRGNLGFLERIRTELAMNKKPLLPILRKDFIFDPLQVEQTAMTPASAMLLIVRMLPSATVLRRLRELAESFRIQSVIEIFNEKELKIARDAGAKVIQVNARDLESFKVDSDSILRFIGKNPPEKEELWIAASGIETPEDLKLAQNAGYHAVLIGTALMEKNTPLTNLQRLLGGNG